MFLRGKLSKCLKNDFVISKNNKNHLDLSMQYKKTKNYLLFQSIMIFLFFCQSFYAQKSELASNFKQISTNEGLSHGDALSIVQDSDSFLWIGTNSGLNTYDGYDLKKFKWDPDNAKSIQGNRICKLISTKNKIWICIKDKGLFCYDLQKPGFSLIFNIPNLSKNNFMLEIDKNDHIWFFHRKTGLVTFSANENLTNFKKNTTLSLKKISFDKPSTISPLLKKMILVDKKHFFFDANSTIYIYNPTENNLKKYSTENKSKLRTAYTIDQTKTLVSCHNGLSLWNHNSNSYTTIVPKGDYYPKSNIQFTSICRYGENYYLGTEKGLYKGTLSSENELKIEEIIPSVLVNDVFIDKFNMLWVATSGYGLFYQDLQKLPFGHIVSSESNRNNMNIRIDNFTSAILKDNKNKNLLWIGFRNGLSIFNTTTKKYIKHLAELKEKHIRYIFQDSTNDIWVGTRSNGMYLYRGLQLIKHYKRNLNNINELSSNNIVSISEDHKGQIWIANFNNGIDIYNKKTDAFKHLFHETFNQQSIGSDKLTFLHFNPTRKQMYISTRNAGITIVDFKNENEFQYSHITNDGSINGLNINHIWKTISQDNTLYIGSIGGGLHIVKFQNKTSNKYTLTKVTSNLGLSDNDISSIQIDDTGKIWISGLGLCVYDPKTEIIKTYDVEDGLQSNSFKVGASYYDRYNKQMYFGGVKGVNFFDPAKIKSKLTKTDVKITGIEIFNKPVYVGEEIHDRILLQSKISDSTEIRLKAMENQFSINFKPLNFINPEKNKVRYILEPYHKEWITSVYPNHKAAFSNLPKGDYTFKIQATNKDGIWNSKKASLNIHIQPYWYYSDLAYFIYFIFILSLFYAYERYIKNKMKIEEKLIDAEKRHLLNQEKFDFFTKISHEIRTPLTLIAGPLEDLILDRNTIQNKKEILKSMRKHTNRLLNMVNKLLDFRKMDLGHDLLTASPVDINEFTSEIYLFFKEKAVSKNINYQLNILSEDITVYVDKEKLETILINLLSNAFKFTPNNGSITIKTEIKGESNKDAIFNKNKEPVLNYLKISIIDSGTGIDSKNIDQIFNQYYQLEKNNTFKTKGTGLGLATVKSICQLHHFKINVNSKKNKGSIFNLRIPIGKSYLANDELSTKNRDEGIAQINNENIEETFDDFEQTALDLIDRNAIITRKILLVEDNREIQLFISNHVKKYFKILYAKNGKEGFEIAKHELPDIIISDVMMPVMDGMEFSRLVKNDENLHHIPIILLTAMTSISNELEGLNLGIEAYIRKPFRSEVLLAKIFTILQNRKNIGDYYSKKLYLKNNSTETISEDDLFLQKVISFIEDNMENENLNILSICNHMAMGRTKLYGKIKELTDKSIVGFIRDIKMKKAGYLLKNSNQTIQEVMLYVGLNDPKYFRKHFKEMYGQTPSAYRK